MLDRADIDAVVLDAGGVLVNFDPEKGRQLLAPFGVAPTDEEWHEIGYRVSHEFDAEEGLPDWEVVDRQIAERLGVTERLDEAGAAVGKLYEDMEWLPIPGAAEALRELQGLGLQLAIVSNAFGTVERLLATHQICSTEGGEAARVDIVVDSAVVGVEKPDPAIFAIALDALGVPAHRCLYVGDTVRYDVDGSRAAGLVPVHLDPFGLCSGDDHAHVAALGDLVDALR